MLQITIIGSKKLLAARYLRSLTQRLFTKKTALQSNKSNLIICLKPTIKYNHSQLEREFIGTPNVKLGQKKSIEKFFGREKVHLMYLYMNRRWKSERIVSLTKFFFCSGSWRAQFLNLLLVLWTSNNTKWDV